MKSPASGICHAADAYEDIEIRPEVRAIQGLRCGFSKDSPLS